MKTISLINSDKVALVDDDDYREVSKYRWYLTPQGYVRSSSPIERKHIMLHRFILKPLRGLDTDHINHDPIDNRHRNLRIVKHAQNMANMLKHRDGTSRFKGVCWEKGREKWLARICREGKTIHLGEFKSETVAARAYDKAAMKHFGEFARTNF